MKKIIAITFMLLLGCINGAMAQTDTITIGVSLGLSGKFAWMADMQQKAYRLWENRINQEGGIIGKNVRIIIKDDRSKKPDVTRLYNDFIVNQKVDFVFGPYSSTLTEIAATIAEKYDYPMLAGGAASDKIWQKGYRNIFGMWTPASRYAVGFLEMLVANDIDNIAIISADDSFSLGIARGAENWAGPLALNIKYFGIFKKGTRDLSPYVTMARDKGAQVLITTGHFEEAIDTSNALNTINWKPKIFMATVGPTFSRYYDQLKEIAEGVCSISIWEPHPQLRFPGAQEFAQAFVAAYGIQPTYHAATAYAAGEILAQAIGKAGSLDKDKIRTILSAMSTYSIIGRYGVDRTGLQVKRFPLCIQWQKGKKEIVWPEELSTAKPIFND